MILNRDTKGNLLTSQQPNYTGSVIWVYPKDPQSPDPASMGDASKQFWFDAPGNIYGRWAPLPGKELLVIGTMLVAMNGCDLASAQVSFKGTKNGADWFERKYSKLIHYLIHADRKLVFADRTEYHWDYVNAQGSAISLKSSESAQIDLIMSQPFTGGEAYLRLKCLSVPG